MWWHYGWHTELCIKRFGIKSWPGHCVLYLGMTFTHLHSPVTATLSTQDFNWVLENCQESLTKIWPEIPHPGEVVIKPLHSCGKQLYKFFKTEESVYVGKAFQSCRIDMVHQHGHHFNVLAHLFDSCDSVEMILTYFKLLCGTEHRIIIFT